MLSINSDKESAVTQRSVVFFGVIIVAALFLLFLVLSKMIAEQKYLFLGGLVRLTLYAVLPNFVLFYDFRG